MSEIPQEHRLVCEGCGKLLDMRDISVVLHGWVEGDVIVCHDTDADLTYSSSRKVGEPVQWTIDKKPIALS